MTLCRPGRAWPGGLLRRRERWGSPWRPVWSSRWSRTGLGGHASFRLRTALRSLRKISGDSSSGSRLTRTTRLAASSAVGHACRGSCRHPAARNPASGTGGRERKSMLLVPSTSRANLSSRRRLDVSRHGENPTEGPAACSSRRRRRWLLAQEATRRAPPRGPAGASAGPRPRPKRTRSGPCRSSILVDLGGIAGKAALHLEVAVVHAQLAATGAVLARRIGRHQVEGTALEAVRRAGQCTHRADLDDVAGEVAVVWVVGVDADLLQRTALDQGDERVTGDLLGEAARAQSTQRSRSSDLC